MCRLVVYVAKQTQGCGKLRLRRGQSEQEKPDGGEQGARSCPVHLGREARKNWEPSKMGCGEERYRRSFVSCTILVLMIIVSVKTACVRGSGTEGAVLSAKSLPQLLSTGEWEDRRSLVFAGREIVDVEIGTFNTWYRISELDLSSNRLASLEPGVFKGLPFLLCLHLSSNLLTAVDPEVFSHIPSLEVLALSGNRIAEISENAFLGLPKLKVLDISYNLLKQFPLGPLANIRIPFLRQVKLNANRISTIPPELPNMQTRAKYELAGNPLLCDSNLYSLKEALTVVDVDNSRYGQFQKCYMYEGCDDCQRGGYHHQPWCKKLARNPLVVSPLTIFYEEGSDVNLPSRVRRPSTRLQWVTPQGDTVVRDDGVLPTIANMSRAERGVYRQQICDVDFPRELTKGKSGCRRWIDTLLCPQNPSVTHTFTTSTEMIQKQGFPTSTSDQNLSTTANRTEEGARITYRISRYFVEKITNDSVSLHLLRTAEPSCRDSYVEISITSDKLKQKRVISAEGEVYNMTRLRPSTVYKICVVAFSSRSCSSEEAMEGEHLGCTTFRTNDAVDPRQQEEGADYSGYIVINVAVLSCLALVGLFCRYGRKVPALAGRCCRASLAPTAEAPSAPDPVPDDYHIYCTIPDHLVSDDSPPPSPDPPHSHYYCTIPDDIASEQESNTPDNDNEGHKIGDMSGLEPGTSRFRVEHSATTPHEPTAGMLGLEARNWPWKQSGTQASMSVALWARNWPEGPKKSGTQASMLVLELRSWPV
ncbi:hypothetical protein Bbelb_230200 [Branchiostoma belcheri]|nr:hypothetical protein Bbelb_230200 [Branchiostoma belcheri]